MRNPNREPITRRAFMALLARVGGTQAARPVAQGLEKAAQVITLVTAGVGGVTTQESSTAQAAPAVNICIPDQNNSDCKDGTEPGLPCEEQPREVDIQTQYVLTKTPDYTSPEQAIAALSNRTGILRGYDRAIDPWSLDPETATPLDRVNFLDPAFEVRVRTLPGSHSWARAIDSYGRELPYGSRVGRNAIYTSRDDLPTVRYITQGVGDLLRPGMDKVDGIRKPNLPSIVIVHSVEKPSGGIKTHPDGSPQTWLHEAPTCPRCYGVPLKRILNNTGEAEYTRSLNGKPTDIVKPEESGVAIVRANIEDFAQKGAPWK
ncbi:hypothetical protein HYW44_04670 [Candidatus Daviesbacteria bacterium]|nr:hypothetical protein [Candidatus Daviesbacteria bacterium]